MISKLDITKFGLFKDYNWNLSIGKTETFKRLNIIYGRNYSGKTTLARIFKCLEDNTLHRHYLDCGFSITLDNNQTITVNNLGDFGNNYKLRVYNTDFVKENLSWLHNDEGFIEPFTILGSQNIDLDKQINNIDEKLGSIEKGTGLLTTMNNTLTNNIAISKRDSTKVAELEEKLRKRANDVIKVDGTLFLATASKKGYTITDIKQDISSIENDLDKSILSEEIKEEKLKLLKEVTLDDLGFLSESKPKFSEYYEDSKTILERKIKPNNPIIDLINDSILQEWVHQGINKHKGKRSNCGFCGNILPNDLWDKLDEHFSKESEDVRADLKAKISLLQQAQISLNEFLTLKKENFYSVIQAQFERLLKEWHSVKNIYNDSIQKIIFLLQEREKDIFKDILLPEISDVSESLSYVLKQLNVLISAHNNKTKTLAKDQIQARKELRLSNISQFLKDIEYQKEIESIIDARHARLEAESNLIPLKEEIRVLHEMKRALETQAKDESKGAELINQHLNHFFGHNELKLVAEGETPNMKFKINREGDVANNLSEGECSLISFCYFIAKMEDELKDETDSKKLIIYIDDPISSLDTNHIFFMFSLIESIIAAPKKYAQLFISTHNMDFLKYLKRLTFPKIKLHGESKDHPDVKYFIIERKNKAHSQLKPAPSYLKDYITEFNYLFEEILKCSTAEMDDITLNHQYNFGNNMRKFLEAYLFYKYPTHKMTQDQKIRKYFNYDSVTTNLINRVINEYSHIGEQFERGMEPVDIDEIKRISKAVINKIQEDDKDQYDALIESVA